MIEGPTNNINFSVAAGKGSIGGTYGWMSNNKVGTIYCISPTGSGGWSPTPVGGGYTWTWTWMTKILGYDEK
jgi:hypothetical protein